VGDAEFQKKAIGKMQEVSRGGGRTVLFVSHNMGSIQNLCERLIVMNNGKVSFIGGVYEGISTYLKSNTKNAKASLDNRTDRIGGEIFRFTEVFIQDSSGNHVTVLSSGGSYSINVRFSVVNKIRIQGIRLLLKDDKGIVRILANTGLVGKTPKLFGPTYRGDLKVEFEKFPLPKGNYNIHLSCYSDKEVVDDIEEACSFHVAGGDYYGTGKEAAVKEGVLVDYKVQFN